MPPNTVKETEDILEPEAAEPGSPGLVLCFSGNRPYLLPFPLRNGALSIGRDELEARRIQDDRLSRRHVLVERTPDGAALQVRDLGSTNGVFLNGERLPAHTVTVAPAHAVLRMGRTLFLLVPNLAPFQAALDRPTARDGVVVGPTLHCIHKQVTALARSGQGLFLRGESGCGKEITARLYHQASPRSSGPLVAVNCATIPKELAERLLFGAVRGAYSGAVTDVPGYLQAAHGGTLFLDEVAELELSVQAKLLRVLETREVVQLGSTRPQAISVGICAATLRDLGEAVAAGAFREDLYYRIARPEIYVPPLRERLEEIPYLVSQTVEKAAGCMTSASLVEACLLRPWPGNVRELCAEVHAAAVLATAEGSEGVLPRHLMEQAGRRITARPAPRPPEPPPAPERIPEKAAAAAPPEEFLRAACDTLGIAHRTLRKLLAPEELRQVQLEFAQLAPKGPDFAERLRARVAEALFALLASRDFYQSEVAAALDTSRTTLMKLMDDLGLPRATELSAAQIEQARAQAGGDLEAAARLLRVSPAAIKKRLALLRMPSKT